MPYEAGLLNNIRDLIYEITYLVLLCHKISFTLVPPQQGHCPRRAMSAWLKLSRSVVIEWAT